MATKAERHRYRTERSGPSKRKRPRRSRRDVQVDTSKAGVSATRRRAGRPRTASRTLAAKAPYALEPAGEGRPSRKSTRKSGSGRRTDRKMQAKRRASLMRPRKPGSRSAR